MIIVSVGMERAGSRWYYNLTNDLAIVAGYRDARDVRETYRLHSVLNTKNCNMARRDGRTLKYLEEVSREAGPFTIKTHRRPSRAMRRLIADDRLKAAYVYRDLRDVIVSGLEVGRKKRAEGNLKRIYRIGPYRGFARLHTVKGGIRWARWQLIPRWEAWTRTPGVLATRYEDLLADPCRELRRLADHLDFDVSRKQIEQVVGAYRSGGHGGQPDFLNKGVAGRYKEVLSPEEQELCRVRLGSYLKRMGYPD